MLKPKNYSEVLWRTNMRIRVRKKSTGKTGTIEEGLFNPDEYEKIDIPQAEEGGSDFLSQILSGVEKWAPTAGAIGAPVAGALSTGGLSIPASGLLSAAGYAGGRGVSQVAKTTGELREDPQGIAGIPEAARQLGTGGVARHLAVSSGEVLPGLARTGAGATSQALIDMLGGKAAQAVGGAAAKVGLRKFITPKALQGGIDEAMTRTGSVLDDAVKTSTGKVKIAPIVDELQKVRQDALDKGVSLAAKKLASGFWQDVYGEAGKELTKRGVPGILEKKGKQISAGMLSSAVKDNLKKEGLTSGVEAFKAFHDLGIISKQMERPFKNWWAGTTATGIIAGAIGAAPAALPAAITLLSMPYTRLALRKALSESLKVAGAGVKGLTVEGLNKLFRRQE
jgi:hypothetical protein